MTASLPPAVVEPRRFVDPTSGTVLEPFMQPLWSTFGLNNAALPQEAGFFAYAIGGTVPGAGNAAGVTATLWHTNLELPSQLARPKRFTCWGIRVILRQISFTAAANTPELSDPGFGTAGANNDLFDDLVLLTNSGHLQFRVGEKFYADDPLFVMASNIGYSGIAAVGNANGTAATINQQTVANLNVAGLSRRFDPYPILIENQQSFSVTIRFPWATPPTMVDDRALQVWLDGKLTREVQ